MKLMRVVFVCGLLLLAAAPSFALPCMACTGQPPEVCELSPGSGTRCRLHVDWCEEWPVANCSPFVGRPEPTTVLGEWTVASIEIKGENRENNPSGRRV